MTLLHVRDDFITYEMILFHVKDDFITCKR